MKPMNYVSTLILLLIMPFVFATNTQEQTFIHNKKAQKFIDVMVSQHQFDREYLVKLFSETKPDHNVLKAISSPYEEKPWYVYKRHFLTQQRVDQGLIYWKNNEALLAKAEKHYGVPQALIVALVGVESNYGAHKGDFPVFSSLATLAFNYPKRSKFFTKELSQYLLVTRQKKIDPLSLKGSYAGAIGQPQFMPSSFRAYAVDFQKDGTIDLMENNADVIGSIANYLARNGWKRGQPIADIATVKGQGYEKIAMRKLAKPRYTLKQLERYGVSTKASDAKTQRATLFEYDTESKPQFWLGYYNFYVIMRYNRSPLYALAVYQLSQDIIAAKKSKANPKVHT